MVLIGSWAAKNLFACQSVLNRPMSLSRFRVGRCGEPLIRLLIPLWARRSASGVN